MDKFQHLKDLCKDLTILYAEDNEDARQLLESLLKRFFKKVVAVENGLLGLNEYGTESFDIVITDIQMPKMNGIEMIREIKKFDCEAVVGITTAFNDEQFFLDSIDLGVNKYILKPIDTSKMLEAIEYLAMMVNNRVKAKEYEQKQIQERVNEASKDVVASITQSTPNPTIIYEKSKLIYINDALSVYLDTTQQYEDIASIERLFLDKPQCITTIESYDDKIEEKNKVALQYKNFTKYFSIIKTHFEIAQKQYDMLTFNDVTKLEYTKIKLESYNNTFREYIFHYSKKKTAKKEDVGVHTIAPQQSKERYDKSLDESDKSLLRRSHTHKTSAAEYLQELDDETLVQMQELGELNDEMSELVVMMQHDEVTLEKGLEKFSLKISFFVRTISILFEFSDLIKALDDLVGLSEKLAHIQDQELQKNSIAFIEAIIYDLKVWVNSIFIAQDSLDIHYLDSSLFSSCLQLEMMLNQDEDDDDSDDIDFF